MHLEGLSGNVKLVVILLLRALTLGGKFLLILVLAHWLDPAELGVYGLIAAAIGYAIYIIGWDFYTFSGRELIAASKNQQKYIMRQLGFLYSISIIIGLLFLLFTWMFGAVPRTHVAWIAALLIVEYISQEIYRILVAMSRQIIASIVLFLRMGAWSLLVVFVMKNFPESRDLSTVLWSWLILASLSCLIGFFGLIKEIEISIASSVDWGWILRGIATASPLFVASLSSRGLSTFDRFFLEAGAGLEILGAYILYAGVASAILSFLDAGVVDLSYPRLVACAKLEDRDGFLAVLSQARRRLLLMLTLLIPAAIGFLHFTIPMLNQPVYSENLYLLYWLLLATTIQAISLVPHLALYGLRRDRAIMFSQLCGVLFFCAGTYLLGHVGPWSIPAMLVASWTLICGWKYIAYRKAFRDLKW